MRGWLALPLAIVFGCSDTTPRDKAAFADSDSLRIFTNDNRTPAGKHGRGVLHFPLELRTGNWYPESDTGLSEPVQAFAVPGAHAQIPAPLLRVIEGTTVRAEVRNTLTKDTLTLYGFHAHDGAAHAPIRIAPGETTLIEFKAGRPGTYFYWGQTTGKSLDERLGVDSQLSGAFVIDPKDSRDRDDRIFVLGAWTMPPDSTGPKPWVPRDVMVINGKSWPHTEHLAFTVGDTVNWRWVNPTVDAHPMHLHGFYFDVLSSGTFEVDTMLSPAQQRKVVTEMMLPGGTMTMRWVPERAGNWVFHCHFAFHVSHLLSLAKVPEPVDPGAADAVDHSVHGMRGLVLGIEVKPRTGAAKAANANSTAPPRKIRLFAQTAPNRYQLQTETGIKNAPGYAFLLRAEEQPSPPADSLPLMSPPLLLHKGEPVAITVINRLRAPTAVHWHGIELDSYVDGVPGWSGNAGHIAPMIAPGDSFVAAFTPPRAGTFIYHSHSNEDHQISSGLYGALIVLEPGAAYDAERERTILITGRGPDIDHGRVNNQDKPDTMNLIAGETYRFRLININVGWRVVVSLASGAGVAHWRPIAKDGADLPASQSAVRPASILMGPGETADFLFTPTRAGAMKLDVVTHLDGWRVTVPIQVAPTRPRSAIPTR